MVYVRKNVKERVPNLEWLKDYFSKVWRRHKGWSLHVLYMEVLRRTQDRDVFQTIGHYKSLGSLMDYIGNLEESV